jgi:hypothetical protein
VGNLTNAAIYTICETASKNKNVILLLLCAGLTVAVVVAPLLLEIEIDGSGRTTERRDLNCIAKKGTTSSVQNKNR